MGARRKTSVAVIAVALAIAAVLPSTSSSAQTEPGCTWTIGIMGALKGDFEYIGTPGANGVRLAVDQANARRDLACSLTVHSENTQGDPNPAPRKAQLLVDDPNLVACVCGFFSGETFATGAIFSDAGVAQLSTGTHPALATEGFETLFRAVTSDDAQADGTGVYIKRVLEGRKVAVVHDAQDYSKRMAKRVVNRLGRRFDGPIYVINPEETDYSAVVSKLRDKDPDVIFFGGYAYSAWPLVRQLREAKVGVPFVSGAGAHDGAIARDVLEDGDGPIEVSGNRSSPRHIANAQEFVAAYTATYGYGPKWYAPDTYDVTNIVIEALRQLSGTESTAEAREHVVAYLNAAHDEVGTVKTYEWGDKGELLVGNSAVWMWKWRKNEFRFLGSVAELSN